jgi:phosphate-selective porin OprO/OprP
LPGGSCIEDSHDQISNANGYDLTGRITGLPVYRDEGRELVHLGLSYLHRFRNDAEDDPTAQDRTRPELRLMDEWPFVNSHSSLGFSGWYLQGSWILTGENRKYHTAGGIFAGVSPEKEFRLGEGGWGALELALRLSRVDLNDKYIEGGKERNFTAGLNCYLRRKIRFMVNYIHVKVEDRADPDIDNGRADIIMTRFQVNF